MRALNCILLAACLVGPTVAARLEIRDDATQGQWHVLIDNREVLVYQYGQDVDLPHYWPLRSPSGKNMLTQKEEPYPHHPTWCERPHWRER